MKKKQCPKCNLRDIYWRRGVHFEHEMICLKCGHTWEPETMNKIQASLASIPEREDNLKQVVDSLVDQVDRVCVFLNGYDHVPEFLYQYKNVTFQLSKKNIGDAGKFKWANSWEGYYLTCDDDLIYPPDYAQKMVEAIEKLNRVAIVGLHGLVVDEKTMITYYLIPRSDHWNQDSDIFRNVNLLGTGVMAYHTSAIWISLDDFKEPNMADIWFAIQCQKQKVPCVTIPRKSGWLKQLRVEDSIFDRFACDDELQTEIVREHGSWEVFNYSHL